MMFKKIHIILRSFQLIPNIIFDQKTLGGGESSDDSKGGLGGRVAEPSPRHGRGEGAELWAEAGTQPL